MLLSIPTSLLYASGWKSSNPVILKASSESLMRFEIWNGISECSSYGAKQRTQFVFFNMFSLFNWYTGPKALHVRPLLSPGSALSVLVMQGIQFPFPCSLYWQTISDERDKAKETRIQTSNLEQQEIHVAKCPIYHYQYHWTQHLSALLNHHGLYKTLPSQFLNVFVVLYHFSL